MAAGEDLLPQNLDVVQVHLLRAQVRHRLLDGKHTMHQIQVLCHLHRMECLHTVYISVVVVGWPNLLDVPRVVC